MCDESIPFATFGNPKASSQQAGTVTVDVEQLNLQANQHLKEYADQVPEEFALLLERLSQAALDEKLMREIEMEKEIMNSWLDQEKAMELKMELKVAEANRQKEEERRQKEEALEKE